MEEKISAEELKTDPNSEELNNLEIASNPANDFFYFLFDLIKTALIVFVLAFSLRYFVIQPFIVDGESMLPSYINNEYILVEKISYLAALPKRGDVVVFRYPGNPNVNYIKRIIGLPGETVRIKNNKITVLNSIGEDGAVLEEEYLTPGTKTLTSDRESFLKTLGRDEYFVLGDNRQHSSDSREWGGLPRANLVGRAWFTVMPMSRFGLHSRITYSNLVGLLTSAERALAHN